MGILVVVRDTTHEAKGVERLFATPFDSLTKIPICKNIKPDYKRGLDCACCSVQRLGLYTSLILFGLRQFITTKFFMDHIPHESRSAGLRQAPFADNVAREVGK